MGEYSRTENGQNGETDWDLRSILRDLAKSGWVILLIACSAAMVTYTVLTVCHRDRYTVKTTFAVMGRGENASAASSLAATYDMTQKFEAILENSILKKKVTEELKLSSFPAKMSASIVPESNLMELSVTADSPQTAFRILKSVLENYTSVSDYIIPAVVLETLQQPQVTGIPSNEIPKERYAVTAFLAAALATAGMVLLDGDLRNPSVMKCIGLFGQKGRGMTEVLKGQIDGKEALYHYGDLPLKILPGGERTQNPAGLLRSARMKALISSLQEEADLLIIDTPPCGVISDAALFGKSADGAVLVVHQGTTKDREVQRALEFFEDSQLPVCGYVLNGVQEGVAGYGRSYGGYAYGKYGYGYGRYGYGKERERRKSEPMAREQGMEE